MLLCSSNASPRSTLVAHRVGPVCLATTLTLASWWTPTRVYAETTSSGQHPGTPVTSAHVPGATQRHYSEPQPSASGSEVAAETPGEAWFMRTQRQLDAARAETSRVTREEVSAYCEHVAAAHRSEAAHLRSPWVAARGTTLQRGEVGASERDVSPRVRAGVGLSFSDWWRAGLVEERGQSACALYEAQTNLRSPSASVEALSLDGWKQKVSLLSRALAEAKTILEHSDVALERGDRTIVEHLAVLSDYQHLEQQLSHAEMEVARVALVDPPVALKPHAINALRSSVAAIERVEGALRRNKTVAVDLEGGYDEIFGTAQRLPVYGQVNVTFRPGYFWQHSADATSETERARAAALAAMTAQAHFRETVVGVSVRRGPMANEVERLRELIALLQQKYDTLRGLTRPDAQHVTERLWFQLQVSRAEMAHLEASLAAMDRWLATVR